MSTTEITAEALLPASCCAHCGLSWHDCHKKRHDEDGDSRNCRNCCGGCGHLPDADRERDEIRLDQMRKDGTASEGLVAILDSVLSLDYTIAQALAFDVEAVKLSDIQHQFYREHIQSIADVSNRIGALTGPYFDRLGPDAVMREVQQAMPPAERTELEQLLARAFPDGYLYLDGPNG
jgi:hypothetical protein